MSDSESLFDKFIRELEEYQKSDEWLNKRSSISNREVRNLENEILKLKKALKFYANDLNWDQISTNRVAIDPVDHYIYYNSVGERFIVGGKIATEALE